MTDFVPRHDQPYCRINLEKFLSGRRMSWQKLKHAIVILVTMALVRLTDAIVSASFGKIMKELAMIISVYVRESDRDLFLKLISRQSYGHLQFNITDWSYPHHVYSQQITLVSPMVCFFTYHNGFRAPLSEERRIEKLRSTKEVFILKDTSRDSLDPRRIVTRGFDDLWKIIEAGRVSEYFPLAPGSKRLSLSIDEQIRRMIDECL
jgi:hypothetical protein